MSGVTVGNLEPYKEIVCEACGALVKYSDLPKPRSNIDYVAIDHKDHFLVIKYDKDGIIRAADVYYKPPMIGKIVIEVECPRCGRKEKIPIKSYPSELAVRHDDHVLVVFAMDRGLNLTSVYDVVELEEVYLANELERIINLIGLHRFTSLLAEIILFERKVIYVPQTIANNFAQLLNYLGFKETKIVPGYISILDDKYLTFFKSFLKSPESFKDLESLKRVMHMIKMLIGKIIEKVDSPEELIPVVDQLKEKGLYDLVVDSIRNNHGIDLEDIVRLARRKSS